MAIPIYLNFLTVRSLGWSYHKRIYRLIIHFIPFYISGIKLKSNSFYEWLLDGLFYTLDIFFVPEFYEIFSIWIKSNTRLFNEEEKELARKYFGKNIELGNLRVNNRISKIAQNHAHAYVTFNTINFKDVLNKEIFVHELVHIWQYQTFGSVYIFRALRAQRSKDGYDYGGIESLYHGMLDKKEFVSYNFEQQGEIFEDYCRIIEYSYGDVSPMVMASYEYFIDQVRSVK